MFKYNWLVSCGWGEGSTAAFLHWLMGSKLRQNLPIFSQHFLPITPYAVNGDSNVEQNKHRVAAFIYNL